jgi:hypothetical protein
MGAPVIGEKTLDVLAVDPIPVDAHQGVFCDGQTDIQASEQMNVLDVQHQPQDMVVEQQLIAVLAVDVFVDAVQKKEQCHGTATKRRVDVIDFPNIFGNPSFIDIKM